MTEPRLPMLRSLSTKLLLAALLSLLCAVAAYLAVFGIGTLFVNRYYMSTSSVAARKAEIYTELNRYVQAWQISGSDSEALQRFLADRDNISIAVYSAEDLDIPPAPETLAQRPVMQSYEAPRRSGISGRLYPMRFADGIYYVAITDNTRVREDLLNRAMGTVVAVLVLVSVLFWYTNRLTWKIIRLSQETATIGAGDLDGVITVDGVDEIATLASDIDGMRDAIIERMGNEKRAWEANSELITAMSHDIRTPMTSLIGYLGLLNNADSISEEERKRYLEAAYGKSLALKELTDELFKYFLVFGRSELELHREDFDIHMLLMQLLGEAEFDLRDSGFNVQSIDRLEDGYLLNTDAAMLKRVIDNLVSNIKKYADRERPVVLLTDMKNGKVSVTASNGLSTRGSGTESTKIGLRTCEKILDALGGEFTTLRDETHFAAEFSLPMFVSGR
ncbi:MAG: HAMP domain-containing histidine kinase [Oscillospiraceae bacterium]|nr:HAMP domain-containing histidine kinase [Oscillospiraceae bacterium]